MPTVVHYRIFILLCHALPEELPALYDPILIAMSPQAFTLAGFERIDGADYAQSWLVTVGV